MVMKNIEQLTRQIAEAMRQSKRFYRRDGLATAMGLRPQQVQDVFVELQENPIYTLKIRQRPFSIQVTAINDDLTVIPFDAEHHTAQREQMTNALWNLALFSAPVAHA